MIFLRCCTKGFYLIQGSFSPKCLVSWGLYLYKINFFLQSYGVDWGSYFHVCGYLMESAVLPPLKCNTSWPTDHSHWELNHSIASLPYLNLWKVRHYFILLSPFSPFLFFGCILRSKIPTVLFLEFALFWWVPLFPRISGEFIFIHEGLAIAVTLTKFFFFNCLLPADSLPLRVGHLPFLLLLFHLYIGQLTFKHTQQLWIVGMKSMIPVTIL